MNIDVCFIVLHYKATDYTIKCVDSILKIDDIHSSRILIYDNGSKNGSFEDLKKYYHGVDQVLIEKNENSAGFTEGINNSYKIAKKLNPQFIVALNNDTEILQKNFIHELHEIDKKNSPFIIGPDVYNPKLKCHQSPLYEAIPSVSQIQEEISKCQYDLQNIEEAIEHEIKFQKTQKLKKVVPQGILNFKRNFLKNKPLVNYDKEFVNNVVIFGCCIIATKRYINRENVLLEPDTKFYGEELLLALKCETLNYKLIYTNQIQVIHIGGIATSLDSDTLKNRIINERKRTINALNIYIKCVNDNPWNKKISDR